MDDFLGALLVFVIVIALMLGILLGVVYGLARPSCEHTLAKMGVDGSWGFWEGCMVKTANFGIIPLSQYMFVLTGK